MRAPKLAWAVLLVCVAAAGAVLLITASLITGQHAHGRWLPAAKLIGVLLLALAGLGLGLVLTWPRQRGR